MSANEEDKQLEHVGHGEHLHVHPTPHLHPPSVEEKKKEKLFYFIRHGKTVTNELLEGVEWGDPTFKEPYVMTDTRLSESGRTHAIQVHEEIKSDPSLLQELREVEVLLASPLTRTLDTAHHVFYHTAPLLSQGIKKVVVPILRERLYMTSDVGRLKSELQKDYEPAGWDFSNLPADEPWWYEHDEERHPAYSEWRIGEYFCKGEPESIFYQRMTELRHYLLSRPEHKILVVAHWGVFHALTGKDFRNCQLEKITSTELAAWELDIYNPELIEAKESSEVAEEKNSHSNSSG